MVDLLTIGGVILISLILISPIVAIVLEEIYSKNKRKEESNQ